MLFKALVNLIFLARLAVKMSLVKVGQSVRSIVLVIGGDYAVFGHSDLGCGLDS